MVPVAEVVPSIAVERAPNTAAVAEHSSVAGVLAEEHNLAVVEMVAAAGPIVLKSSQDLAWAEVAVVAVEVQNVDLVPVPKYG